MCLFACRVPTGKESARKKANSDSFGLDFIDRIITPPVNDNRNNNQGSYGGGRGGGNDYGGGGNANNQEQPEDYSDNQGNQGEDGQGGGDGGEEGGEDASQQNPNEADPNGQENPASDPDIEAFQKLGGTNDNFPENLFPPGLLSKEDLNEIKKQQEKQAKEAAEKERRQRQQQQGYSLTRRELILLCFCK